MVKLAWRRMKLRYGRGVAIARAASYLGVFGLFCLVIFGSSSGNFSFSLVLQTSIVMFLCAAYLYSTRATDVFFSNEQPHLVADEEAIEALMLFASIDHAAKALARSELVRIRSIHGTVRMGHVWWVMMRIRGDIPAGAEPPAYL